MASDNYDAAHATIVTTHGFTDTVVTTGNPPSGPRNLASAWYQFTPTQAGLAVVDSIGSSFDTVGYLLAADGTTLLALDDDAGGGGAFRIPYQVQAETTYFVCSTGFSTTGTVKTNIALPIPPFEPGAIYNPFGMAAFQLTPFTYPESYPEAFPRGEVQFDPVALAVGWRSSFGTPVNSAFGKALKPGGDGGAVVVPTTGQIWPRGN